MPQSWLVRSFILAYGFCMRLLPARLDDAAVTSSFEIKTLAGVHHSSRMSYVYSVRE
jgi:hypothetical protein